MNKLYVVIFCILLSITEAGASVDKGVSKNYARAKLLWSSGEYVRAAEDFKTVRDSFSGESEHAALLYALALEKTGDFSGAEEGFRFFITNYPDSEYNAVVRKMLVNFLVSNGEYARAQLLLHKFGAVYDGEQKLALEITCYLSLVQYSNVNYKIDEFIAEYPNSSMVPYYQQWQAWYNIELADYEGAEKLYSKIIQKNRDKEAVTRAKACLVELLLYNKEIDRAIEYMINLTTEGYRYNNTQLLWLAEHLRGIRELEVASEVLKFVIEQPENEMYKAIALYDLAKTQTDNRKFHDALSLFPLVQKELMSADYNIGKIEFLEKLSVFSNALALRRIGRVARANVMLSNLEANITDPLYYKLMYEQGLVAFSLGSLKKAAKKLIQVGVLSDDPDLAGKALLKCYEACKIMNSSKLMRVCLEELSGKNEGSYGKLYPNSPYTAQAFEMLKK